MTGIDNFPLGMPQPKDDLNKNPPTSRPDQGHSLDTFGLFDANNVNNSAAPAFYSNKNYDQSQLLDNSHCNSKLNECCVKFCI